MNVSLRSGNEKSTFRITTWPGQPFSLGDIPLPFPDPATGVPTRYEIRDAGAVVAVEKVQASSMPAGEIYLDMQRLDLDDETEILRFINSHGVLGASWSLRPPMFLRSMDPGWSQLLLRNIRGHEIVREQLLAARAEATRTTPAYEIRETLTEFRQAAMLIRDLTAAWRALSTGDLLEEGESLLSAIALEPLDDPDVPEDHYLPGTVMLLTRFLSAILTPFHPFIAVVDVSWEGETLPGLLAARAPSLFWLCGLELFNHIAETAEYKICQNERCGRLYVRQRGRARFGQHRTKATKYCSVECARARAQRMYRERQREGSSS